jgi:hypothetical protein
MTAPRTYLSFGGGTQSSAIAMLAINRDERLLRVTGGQVPELYIFADVGDEPKALYPHLADMQRRIEASGARYATVYTALGNLGDHIIHAALNGYHRAEQLPFFVRKEESDFPILNVPGWNDWGYGPIRRRCTPHFKVKPLTAYARAHFGVYRGKTFDGAPVHMQLGISADEMQREKCGKVYKQEWSEYKNPLIEMNWHRADCINYLIEQGIVPRRSACVYCPFHSMKEWREVAKVPEDWARVLQVDDALEVAATNGAFGLENPPYLNRYGVRMRDLDLTEPDDPQTVLWDNECGGVCGV